MRLTKGILAMLCVTALLLIPASAVMANGVFMPSIRDLVITPAAVDVGEPVTITFTVDNASIDTKGEYKGTLKINGVFEAEGRVIVEAESSEIITFTVSRDTAGTYEVNISDMLFGTFTVGSVPATTTPATTTPATTTPATTTPATTTPATTTPATTTPATTTPATTTPATTTPATTTPAATTTTPVTTTPATTTPAATESGGIWPGLWFVLLGVVMVSGIAGMVAVRSRR